MANPGAVIAHPAFGVQIRFLATAEQTNGELLRVEVDLPPPFAMAGLIRPLREERHVVLAGTLRARCGRPWAAWSATIGRGSG